VLLGWPGCQFTVIEVLKPSNLITVPFTSLAGISGSLWDVIQPVLVVKTLTSCMCSTLCRGEKCTVAMCVCNIITSVPHSSTIAFLWNKILFLSEFLVTCTFSIVVLAVFLPKCIFNGFGGLTKGLRRLGWGRKEVLNPGWRVPVAEWCHTAQKPHN